MTDILTNETKELTQLAATTLTPAACKEVGVLPEQMPAVIEMASALDNADMTAITTFGTKAAEHTVSYADEMLAMVNTSDLGDAQKGLKEVMTKATKINLSRLSFARSKVPVIGALIDRFRIQMSGVMADFKNARESIDETLSQIETTQKNLEARVNTLDEAFSRVQDEFSLLGQHILAGRLAQRKLDAEIAEKENSAKLSPMDIQHISDLRSRSDRLEKRIADLMALQSNALTSLPAIRLIQSNNLLLIDKYHNIVALTIPLWKQQMMLGLALDEQTEAAELAGAIEDYTNKLLKQQADTLKKNTIATAKANQRLVIDVSTLEYAQKTLIETVTETLSIQSETKTKRIEAQNRILALRNDFETKLLRKTDGDEAGKKLLSAQTH